MLELFDYGELIVDSIASIGDFLLMRRVPVPDSIVSALVKSLDFLGWDSAADLIGNMLNTNFTMAELILGPSLVVFLVIRLIKFFTDIVL